MLDRLRMNPMLWSAGALLLGVGVVLGALSTIALTAMADGDPTTDSVPRMLPYQGTLENNGQPVNAVGDQAIPLRFSLFDGPTSEEAVYIQEIEVEVFAGRFTTTIGPSGVDGQGETVAIVDVIQAADDLHLGLTLLSDDGEEIILSNRQRIMATPYALWTTAATNMNIANNLVVDGNTLLGGDMVANGNVTVGQEGQLHLLSEADASLESDGALVIGGERNITIDNNELIARNGTSPAVLTVGSPTDVGGNVNVNGNLRVNGGTMRGRPELRRVTRNLTATGVVSIDCSANEVPISCGIDKPDLSAGDEDSIGCFVELDNNRCRAWLDVASNPDGNIQSHCICLRVSE
ncbi:MAG: hypothetical protein AAFX99_02485 [Myxococcota bacterium]